MNCIKAILLVIFFCVMKKGKNCTRICMGIQR